MRDEKIRKIQGNKIFQSHTESFLTVYFFKKGIFFCILPIYVLKVFMNFPVPIHPVQIDNCSLAYTGAAFGVIANLFLTCVSLRFGVDSSLFSSDIISPRISSSLNFSSAFFFDA